MRKPRSKWKAAVWTDAAVLIQIPDWKVASKSREVWVRRSGRPWPEIELNCSSSSSSGSCSNSSSSSNSCSSSSSISSCSSSSTSIGSSSSSNSWRTLATFSPLPFVYTFSVESFSCYHTITE